MNAVPQRDLFDVAPPPGVPAEVVVLFEQYALAVIKAGRKRYSADSILHRIRWHHDIERGIREFKLNDHWTAPLARWFMAVHPQYVGFFETRILAREKKSQ